MEEKNLTYKSPTLTNITLQSIMKEEMKKQVDDYLRKTIFKYTALVLQDFMPDKRTSWNEFVDVTSKAYKKEGFKVLKELLSYITYANIQDFSLMAGIEGVDSADPLIRKFSTCLVDELSYIPKNADKVSLANSAFQYVKGTLLPIATSTRVCRYRSLVDPDTASGGEYITLSQYGMFDCDEDGVFKVVKYNDEAPKYKLTSIGCFLGERNVETNEEMNIIRRIEDYRLFDTASDLLYIERHPITSNEIIFEEFKKVALKMIKHGQIADMTYEILTDKEKEYVGDVRMKLNLFYKISDVLTHKKSFVSFFPEDDELVMSKGVSSEVSVSSNIDMFSETFMKAYDENVGETLFLAEGRMKIIHSLMEAIYKMMANVFLIVDARWRLIATNDGAHDIYESPYLSWTIHSEVTALITEQPRGYAMSMGKPEKDDEPFSVLVISGIQVDPSTF